MLTPPPFGISENAFTTCRLMDTLLPDARAVLCVCVIDCVLPRLLRRVIRAHVVPSAAAHLRAPSRMFHAIVDMAILNSRARSRAVPLAGSPRLFGGQEGGEPGQSL